jgi:hypothetical protein
MNHPKMSYYLFRRTAVRLLLGSALSNVTFSIAAEAPDVVAVASHASPDYVRKKLPDGTFEKETYVFGEGGKWKQALIDPSLDKLQYKHVALTVSKALAAQNYFRATDPDPMKNRLLIMVYWGMTNGTDGSSGSLYYQNAEEALRPAVVTNPNFHTGNGQERNSGANASAIESALMMVNLVNHLRDKMNWTNASILGYDRELNRSVGLEIGPMHTYQQELLEEIEENRYFVVLMAYDFQLLWKEKKPKVLWITRFSIREAGNYFDQQLEAMVQSASRYFGRECGGLIRRPIFEGHVDFGELKILGEVPAK